jgi:hypothetical protein
MNRRISQAQANRSTWGRGRVTHELAGSPRCSSGPQGQLSYHSAKAVPQYRATMRVHLYWKEVPRGDNKEKEYQSMEKKTFETLKTFSQNSFVLKRIWQTDKLALQ